MNKPGNEIINATRRLPDSRYVPTSRSGDGRRLRTKWGVVSVEAIMRSIADAPPRSRYIAQEDDIEAYAHQSKVGTPRGWWWHYRRHEAPCEMCRLAYNKWKRSAATKVEIRTWHARNRSHGSRAGYRGHRLRNETACDLCRHAENTYQRAARRTRGLKVAA